MNDPLAFPESGNPFAPHQLYHAVFPQNDRLLLQLLVKWLSSLDTRFRGTDEFTHSLLLFAGFCNPGAGETAHQLGEAFMRKGFAESAGMSFRS